MAAVELMRYGSAQTTTLTGKSRLLAGIAKWRDDIVIANISPGTEKSKELTLFRDMQAAPDGVYELELAVIIPDWLPLANDTRETSFDILGKRGENRELVISNQMTKLAFEQGGKAWHAIMPLAVLHAAKQKAMLNIPATAVGVPIKTMISMSFTIEGLSPEDAFESHAHDCVDTMIYCLNRVVQSLLSIQIGTVPLAIPDYQAAHFDAVYFIIKSKSQDDISLVSTGRMATNLFSNISYPHRELSDEHDRILRELLADKRPLDEVMVLLNSAQSHILAGSLRFALLQVVIAGESETAQFVRRNSIKNMVSKTKLDAMKKDMTYSLMCDLVLPNIYPHGKAPTADMVDAISSARSARNDLMHEGKFRLRTKDIQKMYDGTRDYVRFLRDLATELQLPPLSGSTQTVKAETGKPGRGQRPKSGTRPAKLGR